LGAGGGGGGFSLAGLLPFTWREYKNMCREEVHGAKYLVSTIHSLEDRGEILISSAAAAARESTAASMHTILSSD